MKRLKEIFMSTDYVLPVLVIMGIRALVIEPGIGFALTALTFAALVGYKKYLEYNAKPDISEEIKQELESLRGNISGLMIKNASKPAQMMDQQVKRFF